MKDQITPLMEALRLSRAEIEKFKRGGQGLQTTVCAVERILADPAVAHAVQGVEDFEAVSASHLGEANHVGGFDRRA